MAKMSFNNKSINIIVGMIYLSQSTFAAGLLTVNFVSPNKVTETCVVPAKMGDGKYKEKDLEESLKLCSYDLYDNPSQKISISYNNKKGETKIIETETKTLGHCPKINSSNPGTLFMKMNEGTSVADFNSSCKYKLEKKDENDEITEENKKDVKAKFKSSVSCSYTPAILGAYHLSRFFNGAGRVPVAVYRTYDKEEHLKTIKAAEPILKAFGTSKQLIGTTWMNFYQMHQNPKAYPPVFTADGQVYGALSDNPKDEEKYSEVSNFKTYDTRYLDFQKGIPFNKVASDKSIKELAGTGFNQKTVQTVVQIKDVSDMILMDYLLAQDDRIGNIHYKMAWYYMKQDVVDGQQVLKISRDGVDFKKDKVEAEQAAKMAQLGAFQVKEMLLKDNDCGLAKVKVKGDVHELRGGGMNYHGILQKVRHMSLDTYKRLMDLSQYIATPEAQQFFKNELKFIDEDFAQFSKNVASAKKILTSNCESGILKLDANLEDFANGYTPSEYSCK